MSSFIPADDQFYFENFLQDEGVTGMTIADAPAQKWKRGHLVM